MNMFKYIFRNRKAKMWLEIEGLVDELVEEQRKRLLKEGRKIVPTLTPEDMLQPNDYRELEFNPHFRYEEGILAGYLSMQMALRAKRRESDNSNRLAHLKPQSQ